MFIERNRHGRLPGAAGYLSRMQVPSSNGRGCRKFLSLAPSAIATPIDNIPDQFEQVAVLNFLDAVGKNDESAIDLIKFTSLKLVSQLFAAQSQRMPSRMLAQNQS